jgi:hypothetical protein
METSEVIVAPTPAMPLAYSPTAEELKLIQWAVGYKAYKSCPGVIKAIENFVNRKQGSSLDLLTSNQLNMLKAQATKLGASLTR